MSDSYASVIPVDARWQPDPEAAEAAQAYVERVFPDPDGEQEISVEFHDRITVVHPGENLERITCPACGAEIDLDWFQELVDDAEGEFDDLAVTVPCCDAETSLDRLDFEWPCGFARFEISVQDPARDEAGFSADELAELAKILGQPVRQILTRL